MKARPGGERGTGWKKTFGSVEGALPPTGLTYQFLLLHAFHEDDEEVLSLGASVREGLLYCHQQLVPQRFIDKSATKTKISEFNTTSILSFSVCVFVVVYLNLHIIAHS